MFNFAASGQAEEHITGFESYAVAYSEETPQSGDSGGHFRRDLCGSPGPAELPASIIKRNLAGILNSLLSGLSETFDPPTR